VIIRRATPADTAAIVSIWNHYIRTTTVTFAHDERSPTEVVGLLAGPDPAFVAEAAGHVLGFARYFPFRGGTGYSRTAEHTILLDPDQAGRGAGRALMQAMLADARAQGWHTIYAGVSAENDAGVAFHARMGFATVARLPEAGWKFDRWIDLVLMMKRLEPPV
jgi:L-amino acid N-acyltransferase